METSVFTKKVTTRNKNITYYCEPFAKSLSEVARGNILRFSNLPLMLQLVLLFFFTATFRFLLKPLKQPFFVPQMLGAIVLGSSLLGHNEQFRNNFFPPRGMIVLDLYASIGFLLFIFLVSMRVDISLVKRTGGLAFIIGIGSFVVPMIISTSAAFIIRRTLDMDPELYEALPFVANLESTTFFQAIVFLLTDLKLLNSELGRLALSSSLIAGFCSMFYGIVAFNAIDDAQGRSKNELLLAFLCKLLLILVIVFVFRPIILWMMRKTPEGKPLKESYICAISYMILVCSFLGDVTGNHFLIGPMILGFATPGDPPVGSSLLDKIGCFVSAVLLPCYIINIGRKVNVFAMDPSSFAIVGLITFIAVLGKFIGIMIPSLYYKMPFMDALSLAFILNSRGIYDVEFFDRSRNYKMITEECFDMMVITTMLQAAVFAPLAGALYDPSRKFVAYKRLTIQHANDNAELRILACIHEQDNVPAIISILEASNPSRRSPIAAYVLNLEDLVEGSMPLLITHKSKINPSHKYKKINRIINAFHQYEQQNQDIVLVRCFTTISPYSTMHEDVCSLALEKNTSIIIMPFHNSDRLTMRKVNKNVLENAPCSVGILYDRGALKGSSSILSCRLALNVCVIFLGGPDDREALAYGARMAEHPNIRLTVLRLHAVGHNTSDLIEKVQDLNMINEFRINTCDHKHVKYKEKAVTEGPETARALNSMETEFDIILVGRRHSIDSPLLSGLSIWSEIDELGVIGDLLVSSDFKSEASVLVVQQQASAVEGYIPKQLNRITSSSVLVRN